MIGTHKIAGEWGDKQRNDKKRFCCILWTKQCKEQCDHWCQDEEQRKYIKKVRKWKRINIYNIVKKSSVAKECKKEWYKDNEMVLCDMFMKEFL